MFQLLSVIVSRHLFNPTLFPVTIAPSEYFVLPTVNISGVVRQQKANHANRDLNTIKIQIES